LELLRVLWQFSVILGEYVDHLKGLRVFMSF